MVRTFRWLPGVLVFALVATLAAGASAQDLTNRLGLGGGGGEMKVVSADSTTAKFGPWVFGRAFYGLSPHLLLTVGAARGRSQDETRTQFKTIVIPYELGLDCRLLGAQRVSPYIGVGGGTTVWRGFNTDTRITGGTDYSMNGGGGLQIGLGSWLLLDLGARYHHIYKPADVDLIGTRDHARNYIELAAALFAVTGPLHARDTDGDGVADVRDKCPDTAKGCTVDDRGCPKDSDGDGVCDGLDQCPDTPIGCLVDAAGCPKDADEDGVCDGLDTCPDTPKGCVVNATGCPKDSDGDGVCDGVDQCPETPAGTTVDAHGCPPPPPPPVETKQPVAPPFTLESIHFDFNKDTIRPADAKTLARNVKALKSHPDAHVAIHGHCDWIGTDEYNQVLSDKRANAAKAWLVKHGIDASRIETMGHGEKEPAADNTTDDGRAQNRRDEFEAAMP